MNSGSTHDFSAGMWVFHRIVDRYATDGYGPDVSTLEAIEMAGRTGVLSSLDLNYPFAEPDLDVDEVGKALGKAGLAAGSITPVIYNRFYRAGSFTNPDPTVRRAAIDRAHESVEVARRLGAGYVKFWPGQDGFDYPFQANYPELRQQAIDGIGQVARAFPDVQFAIEYKLKEPRTHLFWSTAAQTLLAINDMAVDNVGVVVDFGHSMFAKENPSDALHLVSGHGALVDIELDDNYGEWDDDLGVGTVHLVETLEFLLAMREIGWDRPIKLDLFPYREDPVQAVQESVRTIRRLEECCDRLDTDRLADARRRHDALLAERVALDALMGE